MSESKNTANRQNAESAREVEVLYQKMGDRWFAFSLIGDEVFVGSISPEELAAKEANAIGAPGEVTSRKVHRGPGQA